MRKSLSGLEVKDADKGVVSAVFSTFDVKDSDGDITLPGAFDEQAEVVISAYGHQSWMGALPVGKGTIRQTKTEAILDGRFFLDTTAGRDTFTVVKELGGRQEWSYGYDPVKWSFGEHDGERVRFLEGLKVHEVSPVLLGAGVNTRTLSAKSAAGMRFGEHAASVLADVTGLVDRAAEVKAMRLEKGKQLGAESVATLAAVDAALKSLRGLLVEDPTGSELDVAEEFRREYARFTRVLRGV